MEALENILTAASTLNYIELFEEAVRQLKPKFEEIQKRQLYERGVDGEGKSLGQYAVSTSARKRRKFQPTEHITLFDTGEYYESKELIITDGEFQMSEDPIKNGRSLYDRFGIFIAGWDEQSIEEIVFYLRARMQTLLNEKLSV